MINISWVCWFALQLTDQKGGNKNMVEILAETTDAVKGRTLKIHHIQLLSSLLCLIGYCSFHRRLPNMESGISNI